VQRPERQIGRAAGRDVNLADSFERVGVVVARDERSGALGRGHRLGETARGRATHRPASRAIPVRVKRLTGHRYDPPPMAHRITLIPGDGTGPELTEATRRVLEATGVGFDWDVREAGVDVMEEAGTPLPDETLASVKENKVALKGPITTPIGTGFRSVNVALRHELGLYACLRPCKTYEGVRSRYDDVDLVLVRENTEDLYAGIEYEAGTPDAEKVISELNSMQSKQIASGSGISIKPISRAGSERIVRYAFEYARAHGRKRVSCVTKANIMKFTDGLFLDTFREVAKDYPEIEAWENLVDAICMGLVQRPEEFDVLVLPNLYGDIVSDLTAGLVGGLGVAPGGNIGDGLAVFEATHGSAPKYKGQNKVNPTAMILSGKLMLEHLGEADAAARLETAVADVIREGKSVTYDMKPSRDDPSAVGTAEYADAIIEQLEASGVDSTEPDKGEGPALPASEAEVQ